MRNPRYRAIFRFWVRLRGNGRGRHTGPKGPRASNSNRKASPLGGPFWATISVILQTCFQNFLSIQIAQNQRF